MIDALKKIFLVTLLTLPVMWGCRSRTDAQGLNRWMEGTGRLKVLSTTAHIGDLVKEIGGDRIDSIVLIQGALDPHSYELSKGDGEKFDRADVVFYNGLGLEHGASLSRYLKTSEKAESLGNKILKTYPDRILRKEGVIDPHIWMDISLWKETALPIAERLSLSDPEGKTYYFKRAEQLRERFEEAHQQIKLQIHRIPEERRYLVTSHDAFQYFTRSYLAEENESDWDKRFAAPEGLAPDGQLSPSDIRAIVNFLREHQLEVVFPESNVSKDSIRKVAESSKAYGIKVRICQETLYGDAMEQGLHYLDAMRHNAEVICSYLIAEEPHESH